jgi:hypothetical protein
MLYNIGPCVNSQERLERLEQETQLLKEEVNTKSEELDVRLRCLHEFQVTPRVARFFLAQ